MDRLVEPEILDHLPPADPRAIGSRRDLRLVNRLMGNAGILSRALVRNAARPPRRISDLGAGDGALSLSLARRLSARWPNVRLQLVDRAPAVTPPVLDAIRATGWVPEIVTADVMDWSRSGESQGTDAAVANLFLHHLHSSALKDLLHRVATRTALFAACEPRRNALALAGSHLLGLIGCNAVTRHDAPASVRAGFNRSEISALWPQSQGWRLAEGAAGWSSHLFVAARGAA